ncbi:MULTISPECIES: hypothetical protein [unclassified Anabaena]|nr:MULTISPECIES: hypothetical protein [unclassified Anabaena]
MELKRILAMAASDYRNGKIMILSMIMGGVEFLEILVVVAFASN